MRNFIISFGTFKNIYNIIYFYFKAFLIEGPITKLQTRIIEHEIEIVIIDIVRILLIYSFDLFYIKFIISFVIWQKVFIT